MVVLVRWVHRKGGGEGSSSRHVLIALQRQHSRCLALTLDAQHPVQTSKPSIYYIS